MLVLLGVFQIALLHYYAESILELDAASSNTGALGFDDAVSTLKLCTSLATIVCLHPRLTIPFQQHCTVNLLIYGLVDLPKSNRGKEYY